MHWYLGCIGYKCRFTYVMLIGGRESYWKINTHDVGFFVIIFTELGSKKPKLAYKMVAAALKTLVV